MPRQRFQWSVAILQLQMRVDLFFKSLHELINGKIMIYLEKIILCNHFGPGLFGQPKMLLASADVFGTEEPWPGSYLPLPS